MPFLDHLEELRGRLMRIALVFVIGVVAAYFWVAEAAMEFLRAPLFQVVPPEQQKLYFTTLFENFLTHLKISGYATVFFLSPYLFWELWGFVAPGMYPKERKWVVPFVLLSTACFLAGAGFAYWVLFPTAFKFFMTYGGPTDVPMLTIAAYYGTALKLILLFGLAFEMPVLILLLGALGVVDAPMLRARRRVAWIAITIGSAVFAPPDAVSMIMLMLPLGLLYEASILGVAMIARRREQQTRT
jgi:sec-independent protein translocase protein TatC